MQELKSVCHNILPRNEGWNRMQLDQESLIVDTIRPIKKTQTIEMQHEALASLNTWSDPAIR